MRIFRAKTADGLRLGLAELVLGNRVVAAAYRLTVSGQVKTHIVVICTYGVSPNHLPVIVASDRPRSTLSTRAR